MRDARNAVVAWARWGVRNSRHFIYSMGSERMSAIGRRGVLPIVADCSASVTAWYNFAGAPNPNGFPYSLMEGYTGTLLDSSSGRDIDLALVRPGDIVVYGPGTGEHTALIVEAGLDPLTVSMGRQGDPSFVRISQDGRVPQRFRTFPTRAKRVYWPHGYKSRPPHDQVRRFGYVALSESSQAALAISNGWPVYRWSGWGFELIDEPGGIGATEYANAKFVNPRS